MKTKYYALKENPQGYTHIRIDFYYDLGGYNYFTGKTKHRGYYGTAYPVERTENTETMTAFTGKTWLFAIVKRKSQKAEAEALHYFKWTVRQMLEEVSEENNIELIEKDDLDWDW